jgi:hypothetical protein
MDPLAQEILHIRSRRQQRQDAANIITAAAKDWLQRQKVQQQIFQDHLQCLKALRILSAWRGQVAQRQQIRAELAARRAAFTAAVADAWHAGARGFHASRVCMEAGPYGVAAAFHEWRFKGMLLLAWAELVLLGRCRSKSPKAVC